MPAPGVEVIVFGDLHLADNPPIGRKPGYREEGLAMLREVVGLANNRNAILATSGDLFHKKTPRDNSHRLVGDIIEILRELRADRPLLVVPGNHDLATRGLDSLPDQPLAQLHRAGVACIIAAGWYQPEPGLVLVPRPYDVHHDADPAYYKLHEDDMVGTHRIVIAHGSIIPDHESRPYPTVKCSEIDWTGIDVLVSGHIHEYLGTHVMIPSGGIFTNVGSLGRVARTESNRTRTVKCVSIRWQGSVPVVEEIPLRSALPAEDIFVEQEGTGVESDAIAEFVGRLTDGLQLEQIGDVRTALAEMEVPDHLIASVLEYLEEAGL